MYFSAETSLFLCSRYTAFFAQGSHYCIVLAFLPVVVVTAFFVYCRCKLPNMTQGIDRAATDFKYNRHLEMLNLKHQLYN